MLEVKIAGNESHVIPRGGGREGIGLRGKTLESKHPKSSSGRLHAGVVSGAFPHLYLL